nr:MAG TPA: hypothetical protein [Caudoviricetes sp.]
MDNPKKNAEGYNDPTPYEAEKHIRAQIRGKQARLAGSYFEAMISGSCDYYLAGPAGLQGHPQGRQGRRVRGQAHRRRPHRVQPPDQGAAG